MQQFPLHQTSMRRLVIGLAVALGVLTPTAIDANSIRHGGDAVSAGAARADLGGAFSEIGTLDRSVLDLALGAAACAVRSGDAKAPRTLTVIDYSRPSSQERLWVFDLTTRELVYEELVAHGQGTGANLATMFSNDNDSHQTSLGLFVTDTTYVGKNGYSLRLDGLDEGFNDKARQRAIVMHGAPYVSDAFVRANGRLGRSWGCPAVSDAVARELIDRVKGGGLVFAYYPHPEWLKASKYLGGCR
jgi:hypothetical protein